MNWVQRLNRLPIIFHAPRDLFSLKQGECLEGRTKGATYIATRNFLPTLGIVYAFSFKGVERGRHHLIRQITKELGTPEAFDHSLPCGLWMYLWKAPSREIPKTGVHRFLGQDRIDQICQQHGLDEEDGKIVDVCLATLRATMGTELETRLGAIAYALQSLPPDKVRKITLATLQITQEFVLKRHSRRN